MMHLIAAQAGTLVKSANSFATSAYVPLKTCAGEHVGWIGPNDVGLLVAVRLKDALVLWPGGLNWMSRDLLMPA